jgi:hypothetical protein
VKLNSPNHGVLGASDLDAAVGYLVRFGFAASEPAIVPADTARALYGLEGETREAILTVSGLPYGGLRVVETPHPPRPRGPLDRGPYAVDLYTTDIERSLSLVTEAGGRSSAVVEYRLQDVAVWEAKTEGPEGLSLVFIELGRRRPSLLDRDPDLLHSEVQALVWVVGDGDRAQAFWRKEAGLHRLRDATIEAPNVAALLDLPRPDAPVRIVLLSDEAETAPRLELIEFPRDGGADHPSLPLTPGLHAAAFAVADLDRARSALSGAEVGEAVKIHSPLHGEARATTGLAPGGVRFELWERAGR